MEAALSTYGTTRPSLNPKGVGNMFLQNVGIHIAEDQSLYIRKYICYNTGSPCQCGNIFDIAVKRESLYTNIKAFSNVELFESI